jgi:hypothetical protein
MNARLLGDPQFPEFISDKGHRARTVLFRSLFETYSKLALTNLTDRSIAISGLESRFGSVFKTEACYGIFQCYLHWSILWQRSGDKMERINPLDKPGWKVPSWSWMAYKGGISYMDIPFDEVEWSNAVKCFPSKLELQAPVREFLHYMIEPQNETTKCAILAEGDEREWLQFDVEDMTDIQRLKCIVVGRARLEQETDEEADEQYHYVLVVTQRLEGGHRTYERVGVGSIQRRHISFEGGEFEGRII